MTIVHMHTDLVGMYDLQYHRFLQTYSLKQSINKFWEKGISTVHKEMQQLHDHVVFWTNQFQHNDKAWKKNIGGKSDFIEKRETKPPKPEYVKMEAWNERTSLAKKQKFQPQRWKLSSLQEWSTRKRKETWWH